MSRAGFAASEFAEPGPKTSTREPASSIARRALVPAGESSPAENTTVPSGVTVTAPIVSMVPGIGEGSGSPARTSATGAPPLGTRTMASVWASKTTCPRKLASPSMAVSRLPSVARSPALTSVRSGAPLASMPDSRTADRVQNATAIAWCPPMLAPYGKCRRANKVRPCRRARSVAHDTGRAGRDPPRVRRRRSCRARREETTCGRLCRTQGQDEDTRGSARHPRDRCRDVAGGGRRSIRTSHDRCAPRA